MILCDQNNFSNQAFVAQLEYYVNRCKLDDTLIQIINICKYAPIIIGGILLLIQSFGYKKETLSFGFIYTLLAVLMFFLQILAEFLAKPVVEVTDDQSVRLFESMNENQKTKHK